MKLKIDQLYQDQFENHRKTLQTNFDKERRVFEEEKRKRLLDIQSQIDRLNITTSDKEKLRQEIDTLNREQKELNRKIEEFEKELEIENGKKRQLERDINEFNIQLQSQKATGGGKEESHKIVWLREELSKKTTEIQVAQKQYKELLESKFDL